MSLFPAYSEQVSNTPITNTNNTDSLNWLENSSFQIDPVPPPSNNNDKSQSESVQTFEILSECSDSLEDDEPVKPKKRKKHKKRSRHKKVDRITTNNLNNDDFTIDVSATREYLNVKTISRPTVSKYKTKYYLHSAHNKKWKTKKFKRYFRSVKREDVDKSNTEEETVITKNDLNTKVDSTINENFTGFKQETELTKTTGVYNKSLAESPHDIKLWLKYVDFQNLVYEFEKTYRKGSIAKALKVLAERKIEILDKALLHNTNCEELLREKVKVAVSTLPADELQEYMKKLVHNDQGNIILWQGYIEASQCSMSHCNTSAVLELYTKCLSTLHQLRRHNTLEKQILEENILRMLYQCGLFLKQAGLFEQLWTMIRMYLEINFASAESTKFNISSKFNEKHLQELEEIVLDSELPLHELWLRVEKLRESCHWLPYTDDDGQCDDPQRIVFTEDVVELIHPVTLPENVFKLVATVLTLLKVPLLPCRHTTMQELGLDYVPWSLDSIESLLSIFYPIYPIDVYSEYLLPDTNRLVVGPQYLKLLPGQEEYLEFVLRIMETAANSLENIDEMAVRVWWFRFQRLLIILEKNGRFKMPQNMKKKIKSNIKNLLKHEEHRSNEIFYLEFSLIEKELSGIDSCLRILETAITMNRNEKLVSSNWDQAQTNQCRLYRNLVEILIETNTEINIEKAIKHLTKFVIQRDFEKLTQGILMEANTKFRLMSLQLLQTETTPIVHCVNHFLPDFPTDWLICNSWFLYLTKGPLEAGTFLEEQMATPFLGTNTDNAWRKELLYECYVAILFKYCVDNRGSGIFKVLDDVLFRAIELFPNNVFFLSVLVKEQSYVNALGSSMWKIEKLLLKTGRAIATLFVVLCCQQIKCQIENGVQDTITGQKIEFGFTYKYKMLALYRKITDSNMCTRRCGLVWRLYLQFVEANFDLEVCRKVYYAAVEECPWLKALYIDAAIYIPAELAQIQDLIIEKQLRLHVTPEELDILRN